MTVTIVETRVQARAITGGVDTHAGVHVAAALDPIGGLLGVQEFPATRPDMPSCWAGWAGPARCAWPGSKGPAVTARAWPGTSPRRGCGWWRWTARTGRTGGGRASPILWMRSARPGPPCPGGPAAPPRAAGRQVEAIRALM